MPIQEIYNDACEIPFDRLIYELKLMWIGMNENGGSLEHAIKIVEMK